MILKCDMIDSDQFVGPVSHIKNQTMMALWIRYSQTSVVRTSVFRIGKFEDGRRSRIFCYIFYALLFYADMTEIMLKT